jgi:hypothetical protein
MAKFLIIDKNIFQGTTISQLINFVKIHNVVLPHALIVECIISDDEGGKKPPKNPADLLNRFTELIKAGANIGFSPFSLTRKESESKKPIDCIIDYQGSKIIRNSAINFNREMFKNEAEKASQAFEPLINYCLGVAEKLYSNLIKNDNLSKAFRQNQNCFSNRLKLWIETTDKMRDEILQSQISAISGYVTDENNQWFSWQLLRLFFAWAIEWASKRHQSGPSFEKYDISNDFYDMEYVALLCKADGLVSNDKNLIVPLVTTAFSDKTVFASIDRVSDDYML